MVRPRRVVLDDPEWGYYHIISRALQKDYILKEAEKARFLSLLRWLSRVYFVRIATFSLMTTHFHIVLQMRRKSDISIDELRRRFDLYYNQGVGEEEKKILRDEQIEHYYERFSNISSFMQDLKQRFSKWYNQVHDGFGHVWAERFTSVLLFGTKALRACMIYVELNAVRASIVKEPEKYPYCGLAFFSRGGRHAAWLDHELIKIAVTPYRPDLQPYGESETPENYIERYIELVYGEGLNVQVGKGSIPQYLWTQKEIELESSNESSYLRRIPQFSNGVFIGSKEDVERNYRAKQTFLKMKKPREAEELIDTEKKSREAGEQKIPESLRELCSLKKFHLIL